MSEERVSLRKRWRLRLPRRRMGERGPRRLPFDLKKALFILPNAFTVSSIFCGVYAILQATSPDGGSLAFYQAALAIFYAGFFDMFDGRVARLTKTQSDFGVQMDSLADAISFGVAPCVLLYRWALQDFGFAGKIVAFTFAACGVIRLARFNVLEARGEGSSSWFIGLPIPIAASMVVALVVTHHQTFAAPVEAKGSVVALTLVLAYLMVSNVRYYTFKTYRPSLKTMPLLAIGGLCGVAVAYFFGVGLSLVLAIGAYIFYGLLAELLFFRRRRVSDAEERVERDRKRAARKAQEQGVA